MSTAELIDSYDEWPTATLVEEHLTLLDRESRMTAKYGEACKPRQLRIERLDEILMERYTDGDAAASHWRRHVDAD